jgi:hypothetical protein
MIINQFSVPMLCLICAYKNKNVSWWTGAVNLWSNNKKLLTNNEGLVNYGADLLRLSKLSP